MATASHRLLGFACLVTLALLHQSRACTDTKIPNGCKCMEVETIECLGLTEFPNITNTKRFFFRDCSFGTVGGATRPNYVGAEILSLSNCRIEKLQDDAFRDIGPSLQQLELDRNFITNISKDALFLLGLTHLTLSYNSLSRLPADVFDHLSELMELSIDHNDISSLPDNIFKQNQVLKRLDISFAKFSTIPKVITLIPTLRYLIIAGNTIGPLKLATLKGLCSLEYLDLSTTGSTSIDVDAFEGMDKMKTLRLSSNELHEIPRDLFLPMHKTLNDLWLDRNLLTSLENGTVPVGSLHEVHLGFNPWHCDKKIAWFKDLHLEKIDHENVTCSTPASLMGFPLANVTRDMFVDAPGNNIGRSMFVAAIVIPIIVICLLIICLIILKMVQNWKQQRRTQVRYSAVYRDTVESSRTDDGRQYRPTSDI